MRRVGPYEVLDTLGKGGMGVVLRARHAAHGAVHAVKVIGKPGDVRATLRFEREAQNLARVRHPGIVAIHEAGTDESGQFWFAMDLVEGQPLDAILEQQGRLPVERALDVVAGIAEAVAALHAAGIVHRDLKPQNVIVRPDGRPVVLDLGLAIAPELDERLTKTGAMVGTPRYMAPEQLGGRGTAPTTDVYALGLILHELVTGEAGVAGGSAHEMVARILAGVRPRPTAVDPDLPAALDQVVLACTERDPKRRPQDAAGVVALIARVRSAPGPTRRDARRRTGTLVAGGLAVAAVAAAGGWAATRPAPVEVAATAPVPSRSAAAARPRLSPAQLADGEKEARALPALPVEARAAAADGWLARYPGHPLERRVRERRLEALRLAPRRLLGHPACQGALFVDGPGARALTWGDDSRVRLWDVEAGRVVREWDVGMHAWSATLAEGGAAAIVGGAEPVGVWLRLDQDAVVRRIPLHARARALAVAPGGGLLAVAGEKGACVLVGLPDGSLLRRLDSHRAAVNAVAFTPDGQRLITGCGASLASLTAAPDCAVRVLDPATGEVQVRIELFAMVSSVTLAPDQTLVVAANGPRILRYRLDGTQRDELHGEGTALVSGLDRAPPAMASATRRAVSSADGRFVVASTNEDRDLPNELRVFDARSGEQLGRAPRSTSANGVEVSADGRWALIAALDSNGAELWDLDAVRGAP